MSGVSDAMDLEVELLYQRKSTPIIRDRTAPATHPTFHLFPDSALLSLPQHADVEPEHIQLRVRRQIFGGQDALMLRPSMDELKFRGVVMRSVDMEKVVSLEEIPAEPEVDEEDGNGSDDGKLDARFPQLEKRQKLVLEVFRGNLQAVPSAGADMDFYNGKLPDFHEKPPISLGSSKPSRPDRATPKEVFVPLERETTPWRTYTILLSAPVPPPALPPTPKLAPPPASTPSSKKTPQPIQIRSTQRSVSRPVPKPKTLVAPPAGIVQLIDVYHLATDKKLDSTTPSQPEQGGRADTQAGDSIPLAVAVPESEQVAAVPLGLEMKGEDVPAHTPLLQYAPASATLPPSPADELTSVTTPHVRPAVPSETVVNPIVTEPDTVPLLQLEPPSQAALTVNPAPLQEVPPLPIDTLVEYAAELVVPVTVHSQAGVDIEPESEDPMDGIALVELLDIIASQAIDPAEGPPASSQIPLPIADTTKPAAAEPILKSDPALVEDALDRGDVDTPPSASGTLLFSTRVDHRRDRLSITPPPPRIPLTQMSAPVPIVPQVKARAKGRRSGTTDEMRFYIPSTSPPLGPGPIHQEKQRKKRQLDEVEQESSVRRVGGSGSESKLAEREPKRKALEQSAPVPSGSADTHQPGRQDKHQEVAPLPTEPQRKGEATLSGLFPVRRQRTGTDRASPPPSLPMRPVMPTSNEARAMGVTPIPTIPLPDGTADPVQKVKKWRAETLPSRGIHHPSLPPKPISHSPVRGSDVLDHDLPNTMAVDQPPQSPGPLDQPEEDQWRDAPRISKHKGSSRSYRPPEDARCSTPETHVMGQTKGERDQARQPLETRLYTHRGGRKQYRRDSETRDERPDQLSSHAAPAHPSPADPKPSVRKSRWDQPPSRIIPMWTPPHIPTQRELEHEEHRRERHRQRQLKERAERQAAEEKKREEEEPQRQADFAKLKRRRRDERDPSEVVEKRQRARASGSVVEIPGPKKRAVAGDVIDLTGDSD